jgi:uncharacterized protein (TIGR00369 family)
MTGLQTMLAVKTGDLPPPPIAELIGFELVEVDEGRAVFALDPAERHHNPLGTVHGGIAATLLDSAIGCAVHTTIPEDGGYTTLELKVNYLRSITEATGRIVATGTILHRGRTVAMAEGKLEDEDGRLLAHATSTCLIM